MRGTPSERITACGLLLLFGLTLFACAGSPQPAHPPGAAPADVPASPLLWRASQGDSVFYLFGSVHVGDAAVAAFWPAVEAAFEASDELVMEVDLSTVDAEAVIDLIAQRGTLAPPETLATRLPPELWEELAQRTADAGVDIAPLLPMKPWLLLFTMMGGAAVAGGHTLEQGVESIATQHARAPEPLPQREDKDLPPAPASKPIVALESVESQLEVFAHLERDVVEGLIARILDPTSEGEVIGVAEILAAWRRGDADALRALLEPEDPIVARFYERLVFDRNDQMAARLVEMGGDGRTRLVIVGVLHMLGTQGIPAQLERNGYAVERLD